MRPELFEGCVMNLLHVETGCQGGQEGARERWPENEEDEEGMLCSVVTHGLEESRSGTKP